MVAWVFAVNDELVGALNRSFIVIARYIPHRHLIAPANRFTAEPNVAASDAAHVQERGLPANNFRHHAGYQRGLCCELGALIGVLIERQHACGYGIARRVVAALDQ